MAGTGSGAFVKLLANEASGNINNQADHTDGHNTLAWDGKDEQGRRVSAGTYTITIVAEDNAGVGCESNCAVTTVDVQTQPHVQTEITLEWPTTVYWLAQGTTLPGTPGYTDSYSTVFYSIDGGNEQSVEPSYDGLFYIEPPQIPGMHTVTLRTDNAQFPEKIITAGYFVNQFSITGMTPGSRHNTESGSVLVVVNSLTTDTIDVLILDPFDQALCIDPQNPVPVADMLNGLASTKAVRTLATGLSVSAGSNTVNWDGKDDAGQFVPPGIYDILVRRQDSDQLLSTETSTRIVVERPTGAPQISNVVTNVQGACVSVSWNTNVATTGSVLFESEGNAVGRVRSTTASTSHTVWLPRIEPGKEYDFYVLAFDPSAGSTAVSELQTFSTNQGIKFGTVSADIVSPTEATISCALAPVGVAAVEYAKVGPNVGTPQWMRAEHTFTDAQHVFNLTDLQPNSEYVYRITGSENQQWTDCTKSAFLSFVTKTTLPSLEFVDVESGQTVQSISQITVRAADASSARFSSHGITKVELFIDGEQVTSYTRVPSTGHIDYVFDASSLNIGDGLHELEAIAYDDFWKSALGSIRLLVDSQSLQSMAMAAAVVTASGSSGSSVSKEKRKAQAQATTVELVFADKAYDAIINHTFVRTNLRPPLERGFYPLEGWGPKGVLIDEQANGTCSDGHHTCNYYYTAKINRSELRKLNKAISEDGPVDVQCSTHKYALISMPTNSTGVGQALNCVTWAAHVLKQSGIDPGVKTLVHVGPITEHHMCTKYCYQWVDYWPFSPADTATYANMVRQARIKAGKPD